MGETKPRELTIEIEDGGHARKCRMELVAYYNQLHEPGNQRLTTEHLPALLKGLEERELQQAVLVAQPEAALAGLMRTRVEYSRIVDKYKELEFAAARNRHDFETIERALGFEPSEKTQKEIFAYTRELGVLSKMYRAHPEELKAISARLELELCDCGCAWKRTEDDPWCPACTLKAEKKEIEEENRRLSKKLEEILEENLRLRRKVGRQNHE